MPEEKAIEEKAPETGEPNQEEAPLIPEETREANLERINQLELELHNLKKRVAGQDLSIERERQEREHLTKQVKRYRKLDEFINFSQFDEMLKSDTHYTLNSSERFLELAEKEVGLLENGKLNSYMQEIKNQMGLERWKTFLISRLVEIKNAKKKNRKRGL